MATKIRVRSGFNRRCFHSASLIKLCRTRRMMPILSYFLSCGKAGGLQILRCQGFAVAHYSFTLSALALKPSDFCNVRVICVSGCPVMRSERFPLEERIKKIEGGGPVCGLAAF